jgi:GTP cyclohydrolase II
MVVKMAERPLPTKYGQWRELLFSDGKVQSFALVFGEVHGVEDVPCRVHSDCISAHIFNSTECDCREQMEMAQQYIVNTKHGVIIWLDQDGRGHGHLALIQAVNMASEQGISETAAYEALGYSADRRTYREAAAILKFLEVNSITLLTNSPHKAASLVQHGVVIGGTAQLALDTTGRPHLAVYYADKRARGHKL